MRRFKLWLVAVMMILCMGVMTGCFSSNDSGSNTEGSSMGNEDNQESSIGDTSTNGANNTEDDLNNGSDSDNGNEGSVTDNTGDGGVIEELVTDIGDGIEDVGDDLANDENANVNDVTSGRQ